VSSADGDHDRLKLDAHDLQLQPRDSLNIFTTC
jgi:hypothetical protein